MDAISDEQIASCCTLFAVSFIGIANSVFSVSIF